MLGIPKQIGQIGQILPKGWFQSIGFFAPKYPIPKIASVREMILNMSRANEIHPKTLQIFPHLCGASTGSVSVRVLHDPADH